MANFKRIKKARPVTDFDVAFDDQGNLKHKTVSSWNPSKTEKNAPFVDHLEYYGYFSTGNTCHIKLRSLKSGRMYHMFMSDFDDVLDEQKFQDNQMVGLFCFCRKGNSQGIRMMFENP